MCQTSNALCLLSYPIGFLSKGLDDNFTGLGLHKNFPNKFAHRANAGLAVLSKQDHIRKTEPHNVFHLSHYPFNLQCSLSLSNLI